MERRLVAIVAGDVVGYSRLMAEDEAATYGLLRAAVDEVVMPAVARHGGRVFKTTGDGFIADFVSAGAALSAAVEIQQAMQRQALQFRVGLNLGEVIAEDGDLFGDDVNIAVRLQGLAEPGGIRASAAVVRGIEATPEFRVRRIGWRRVKNIPGRIEVYEVVPAGRRPRALSDGSLTAAAAGLAALALVGLWGIGADRLTGVVDELRAALPGQADAAAFRQDGKPSVAVLPFANVSGDAGQAFFSDGLTEDVITALARNRDLLVLARHATFALEERERDVRAVARKLGADYVVEGSARRAGDRLRVVARLVDARSGVQLWSRDYDRRVDDVFDMQADLTSRIVASLVAYVRQSESAAAASRPTENPQAYELVLRARGRFPHGSRDREGMLEARALYQRALQLDPGYAAAHAYLGLTYIADYVEGIDRGGDTADLDRGIAGAREAVRLAPDFALGYQILSFGLAVSRDYEASLLAAERAVALTPGDPDSLMALAKVQVRFGSYTAAVENAEQARRLHPMAPGYYAFVHGQALYAAGRTAEADRVLAECLLNDPAELNCLRIRISALTRLGRLEEARQRMAELRSADPGFSLASERLYRRFGESPLMSAYLADLSAAGAPEVSARVL